MTDENNFDWDNTATEQNENECLAYVAPSSAATGRCSF